MIYFSFRFADGSEAVFTLPVFFFRRIPLQPMWKWIERSAEQSVAVPFYAHIPRHRRFRGGSSVCRLSFGQTTAAVVLAPCGREAHLGHTDGRFMLRGSAGQRR
jgi:hypothetical protein